MSRRAQQYFVRVFAIIALLIGSGSCNGQADDPVQLVEQLSVSTEDARKVELLNRIALAYLKQPSRSNKDNSRVYAMKAAELARSIRDTSGLAMALYHIARYEIAVSGDLSQATTHLLESLSLSASIHDDHGSSRCYMQLGLISYLLDYYEDAVRNFKLSNAANDNATSNYLMALSYIELDSFQLARTYFSKAIRGFKVTKEQERVDECHLYMGRMFVKMGELDSAFHYLDRVIENRSGSVYPYALERPYAFISEAYLLSDDPDNAIRFANRSYGMAMNDTIDIKDNISLVQAAGVLSKAYAGKGDFEKAFFFLELRNKAHSSIAQGSTKQKIADMRSMFDFDKRMSEQKIREQKDKEIAEGRIQKERILRNSFFSGSVLLLLLVIVLYNSYRIKQRSNLVLQEKNEVISKEKQRSDELLLNILPEDVANELKNNGMAEARSIEQVSVLFTDFKDFSNYAERVTPTQLVDDLHECFTVFDHIIAEHGVEKIKTIGDAYMAAGGLPAANNTHALDVIVAALEIRDYIVEHKARKVAAGRPFFEIRLGIHTGPVVAGIVGVKKFSYDIWGKTVNTAASMESSSEVGRVNVSATTYALVKDEPGLTFTLRGTAPIKGKEEIEVYFVDRSTGG